MAKKVFQKRLNASLCAVYEDISEDEFDPTEIQLAEQKKPVSYYTSFNPLYSFYGTGSIQVQQNYFASNPVFATSFSPPPYVPLEATEDVDKWQKTNNYDDRVETDAPTFENDKSFVVKKEPEDDLEEESTVSDNTEQQLIDEYIKTELEEEYSEVEHSECEDFVANDAIVKDEPIVKEEEEEDEATDITEKYVKKEVDSEHEDLSEAVSNKIFDKFYAVPENLVSEPKKSETEDEKILTEWSDISEDEALDGVTNDKCVSVKNALKVNRNLFPNAPNISQGAINLSEKAEAENIVQKNRHFVHSSECDCNGHGNIESSYDNLYQRIPNVSYKASSYREKKILSGDDLNQEKSNVPFKNQIWDDESSEKKITHTNDESRVLKYGLSSNNDDFQSTDLGEEPPKKREKLANYSSKENLQYTETYCGPSMDNLEETTGSSMSNDKKMFSYPSMPYFFEESKDLLADPQKNEVTPSKTSPGKIRAHHVKLLNCPHCTRKYWKESKLKEHMKMHHAERKIKKEEIDRRYEISRCPECKEQLHTKVEMYVHRLTHLIPEFKKVKCPFCDNNQYSFDGLKEHVKSVHNLKDKWFCPICPVARTFTHRNSLLVHISTYHFDPAREAPSTFPCSQCSKVFSSKALLGKHINNNHLGPTVTEMYYKMFKCDICEKSYDKLYDLKKHMKARHMNNQVSGKDEDKTNSDFNEKLKIHNKNLLNKLTPLSGNVVPQ